MYKRNKISMFEPLIKNYSDESDEIDGHYFI
jgi:hypothetical protein